METAKEHLSSAVSWVSLKAQENAIKNTKIQLECGTTNTDPRLSFKHSHPGQVLPLCSSLQVTDGLESEYRERIRRFSCKAAELWTLLPTTNKVIKKKILNSA